MKKEKNILVQFSFPSADVLTYHAAGDTVFSAALDNGDVVQTLQGDNIVIVIDDNGNIFLFFNCSWAYEWNEYNLLHNIVIVIANGMHPVLLLIMVG